VGDEKPSHRQGGLQGEDALYRLVVESAEDFAIMVLDTTRRIVSWNRGAERLLGYAAEEILGRPADLIFTPEDVAAGVPEREAGTALSTGRAAYDRWHMRKGGSRFWGSGVMTRLDDADGRVCGLAKILRDQTELKLAQEERNQAESALRASELRFRRLIEANIIGVGIADAGGAWLEANDALLDLLGHSREELKAGRVRWDRMTPEEFRWLDQRGIVEADRRGACPPYEKEYVRADGRRVPVLIGYAAVSNVEGHYICFVLDLTGQKRIENALREADRRKDEFLAMLAHELRNPLSAIGNSVQVIHRNPSGEHQDWAVEVIDRHVRTLSRMIDDLLDVSRITRRKIRIRKERVEIFPVVARAIETVRPLLEERGHEMVIAHHSAPMWLEADPHRLEQVVVNLLTNAAKYTEAGGTITLTTAPDGGWVVVTVADNGIGIPPEKIPHMFELFAQGDRSIARSEGGLGVGLTLVRSLVEMHGGSVSATSDGPGKGSTFAVRLPAAEPPEWNQQDSPDPTVSNRNPKVRILVVDDNADSALGLSRLLRVLGNEVEVAHDGPSAVELGRRMCPDFILLDIGLPGMDGYEVAAQFRREACCKDATIIAVSGYGEQSARKRAEEAGFDHHLVKPVDYDALVTLIQRPQS
jgi:PAS domain S-box-containing protein